MGVPGVTGWVWAASRKRVPLVGNAPRVKLATVPSTSEPLRVTGIEAASSAPRAAVSLATGASFCG
jgi:hypothetical protein